MEININSLISIEKALNNTDDVFRIVDDMGKVIILKDNKPAYILSKYEESTEINNNKSARSSAYTLQEAMKIVLAEVENNTLHASELADIIYERKLYVQKNGEKAKYNQLRARCGHYPDMFEALPGNYIKLK
jgi:antitoxin Phd